MILTVMNGVYETGVVVGFAKHDESTTKVIARAIKIEGHATEGIGPFFFLKNPKSGNAFIWENDVIEGEKLVFGSLFAYGSGDAYDRKIDVKPQVRHCLNYLHKKRTYFPKEKHFIVSSTTAAMKTLLYNTNPIKNHSQSNPIELYFNRTQSTSIDGLSSIEFSNGTKSNSHTKKWDNRTQSNVRFPNS